MTIMRKVATVFGGSGFLGRYVVKRLAGRGFVVRVAVRDPEAGLFLKPMGDVGQVVPFYAPVEEEADVAQAVAEAAIVVNLTGILAERRQGDFRRIHVEGAGRIARLAAAAGIRHLVHVSAIGADPQAPSLYGRSKAEGEQAVHQGFPAAVILRPSAIFGPEDKLFNRFAALAMISPVLPIFGGKTRFQPVYVGDVADAVMATLDVGAEGQLFELGGPEVKTFKQLIDYTLETIHRHRLVWDMPMGLAALGAWFLQHLPGHPLTPDQIKLLRRDNVVSQNALGFEALGLTPTPLDMVVPQYLAMFRRGGARGGYYPV